MSTRPNLGGLFNGNTAPTPSGNIAIELRPRLVPPPVEPSVDEPTETPVTTPAEPSAAGVPEWLAPMKALGSYFDLLQTLLDANRKLATDWLGAAMALPQRVGLRRG